MDNPPIPPLGIAGDIDAGPEARDTMSRSRKRSSLKIKLVRHLPDKLRAKKNLFLSGTVGKRR